MTRPVAVVAGATGVTGRYLTAHLAASGRWEVIALSRRPPEAAARCRHVAVDLSDAAATRAALAHLGDATHLFYCAFAQKP